MASVLDEKYNYHIDGLSSLDKVLILEKEIQEIIISLLGINVRRNSEDTRLAHDVNMVLRRIRLEEYKDTISNVHTYIIGSGLHILINYNKQGAL